MRHSNFIRCTAAAVRPAVRIAVLAAILIAPAQTVFAKGKGQSTLSVGITIVAADSATATVAEEKRIPVDPAYAIRPEAPLRDARVERVTDADGRQLQVVTY